MPCRRLSAGLLLSIAAIGCAVRAGVFAAPPPAAAEVVHGDGFAGVVDSYRSWFGSYRLGGLGTVWCIDHGIAAPDEALVYQRIALDGHAPETRRAMAWALASHGSDGDRVTAAAVMLVLHDLMGARYPSGPLSLEALDPGALSFEGGAGIEVLERARAIEAEAVGRASLVPPLRIELDVPVVFAGRTGVVTARALDATGAPVTGLTLTLAAEGAHVAGAPGSRTDAGGAASWTYLAAGGANRFSVEATVPPTELVAFAPTAGAAQRVAVPATERLTAEAEYSGRPPPRLRVVKRGDATPAFPVAGARFAIDGVTEAAVGDDGSTPWIEVGPGRHTISETVAPPGYDAAGPWVVDVDGGDVVLEVENHARRGRIIPEKVDALSGAPLVGAVFEATRDSDGDGTFDQPVPDLGAPLLPGRYEVREVQPPPGYLLAPEGVVLDLPPGGSVVARFANRPVPPPEMPKPPPPPVHPLSVPVPPTTVAAAPELPVPTVVAELPRTGARTREIAAAGLGLVGGGLILVATAPPAATSSSGTRGRRVPRRRRRAAADGRCRP